MCTACEGQSESDKPYHVCILTVSDTSAEDASLDKSGPLLKSILDSHDRFVILESAIVPDDVHKIRSQVESWSLRPEVQLILTTGGTGFAPSDVTPEAVAPLIVKQAPGLTQLMLSSSFKITPMAALGRPICGMTTQQCIIVTLPGSPKGAKENLEALLPVLPHALILAAGSSSRALHVNGAPKANQESSSPLPQASTSHSHSHAHSHHHGHSAPKQRSHKTHDPSQGASARNRVSPYPIIPMPEALSLIFQHTPTLPIVTLPVSSALRNHILAESITSTRNIPSTHTTNVDGYATRSTAKTGVYKVWTNKSHPLPLQTDLPDDVVYRVNTGSGIPSSADSVVMVEDTEVVDSDNGEEKTIKVPVQVDQGENVRNPGSDVKEGEIVLEKGSLISDFGGELGTLHFVGQKEVKVYRRPTVAILSTGNELVDLDASDASSSTAIFDTNRPALRLLLEAANFKVIDLGIARDDVESVKTALKKGAQQADVVIATGGTSMGEVDLLKPVIERELNGTIHFGRVAMKPGKPTTFASIPVNNSGDKECLVFSLPGNPASALVTYNLFVLPSLRKLSGYPSSAWELKRVKVQLTSTLPLDDKRPEFHRVHVRPGPNNHLEAVSTGGQRSSKASSMALANGLVCLPSKEDAGKFKGEKGDFAECILLGGL